MQSKIRLRHRPKMNEVSTQANLIQHRRGFIDYSRTRCRFRRILPLPANDASQKISLKQRPNTFRASQPSLRQSHADSNLIQHYKGFFDYSRKSPKLRRIFLSCRQNRQNAPPPACLRQRFRSSRAFTPCAMRLCSGARRIMPLIRNAIPRPATFASPTTTDKALPKN